MTLQMSRPGRAADFSLVHGDPLSDPTAPWRVWRVAWSSAMGDVPGGRLALRSRWCFPVRCADAARDRGAEGANILLERLAGLAARKHWIFIIAWVIILGGLLAARAAFGGEYVNNYTVSGSDSAAGLNVLNSTFPRQGGYGGQIVFHARTGKVSDQQSAVDQSVANVSKLANVIKAVSPFASSNSGMVSKDGTIAYASVAWNVNPSSLDTTYLDQLNNAVAPATKAGLQVEYGAGAGQIGQTTHDLTSEVIGLSLALVLLLIMFGSLLAAAIPLVSAIFSVAAGLALLALIAKAVDFTSQITSRLPWLIIAVVAISFILLTMAFRSVVIAAKAAILNILSIGAAYGVIVAIFEWGWGASLIGLHTTLPIPAYVPMLVFCIVFGLSMDYEVFLLSRVHEAWLDTRDAHRSVAIGIGATARVITTAAIMIVVFTSFVIDPDPTVKMLAIGMAFAVLIDASLVRTALVPSIMSLLGAHAWWLPRWLEPVVPDLQLEGSVPEPAEPERI
jgi:uncharacterized membrane protein YdfJ with MMPL/SSD domain